MAVAAVGLHDAYRLGASLQEAIADIRPFSTFVCIDASGISGEAGMILRVNP